MKSIAILFMAVWTCSVFAGNPESETDVVEIHRTGTNVVPLKIDAPFYPRKALRRGIEGWVVVRFVVKADGTTDDVEVFDSSIEGYFDEAAVKATRARVYQPATLDGKPVMQGNVFLRSVFQFKESDGGVSKPFLKTYKAASKAIDDEDLDLAKSLIDQIDGNEKRLLAEVCYLDMLKGRYFAKTGDDKATLRHIERALVIADTVASKPIYINILKQAIVENGRANNYQISLKRYNTLLDIDKNLDPNDPVHNYVMHVKQLLSGDLDIKTMLEISPSCETCESTAAAWWHVLNRNRFSIDQVVGHVSEIVIDCQNSSVTVAYQPEIAWSVNRAEGDCSIRTLGERGTTFRLIELPNQG